MATIKPYVTPVMFLIWAVCLFIMCLSHGKAPVFLSLGVGFVAYILAVLFRI